MNIRRRSLLTLAMAGAAAPLVGGCDSDAPVITIDTRFPVGSFGAKSTAEEVTQDIDLSGRVAFITGCNSGIGYETMRVLAMRGAHVVGTGRTMEKAAVACNSVEGRATPLVLELSDFQSAVDCASAVRELGVVPDMLICNAGINSFGDLELINGIERHFVINFLGHFVLINQMLPSLLQRNSGRIVHVASQSGYKRAPAAGVDFDNLRGEKEFDAMEAYGQSKLANALFSLALAARLENSGVTSNAVHPGLVQTNIARTAPAFVRGAFDLLGGIVAKSPEEGAATQTYVATSPALEGVNGAYFEDCNPVQVSGDNHMFDLAMAERLWVTAQEMTAGYLV